MTFAIPSLQLGEDITAMVVHPNAAATASDIRQFAASRLAEFKGPSRVCFVDDIPKGPTGKPQRIGLAERLGLASSLATQDELERTYVSPQDERERRLVNIWEAIFDVQPLGIRHDFFELGGYSLLAMYLCTHVEKTLGQRLLPADLLQASTIEQLARFLR